MVHAPAHASALPRTWLPAVLISGIVSILCATALYVLLAQQDRSLVAQRNAAAVTAVESSGRAMARTFAWFSESLLGEHLANVQQALEGEPAPSGLVEAAVISDNNLIVAARDPVSIGRQLQDPGWLAARQTPAGSVSSGLERGRQVLIVVEPLRQQDHIIGWVRLVFAVPQDSATVRSIEDLARDVALVAVPLFLLLATLLILVLRGLMSQVRSLLGNILLEAMGEAHEAPEGSVELSKAS